MITLIVESKTFVVRHPDHRSKVFQGWKLSYLKRNNKRLLISKGHKVFYNSKTLYNDSDAKTQFANDKINKLRFQNHQFLQTLSKPRHADSINRIRWLQWVRRAASATIAPIDNTKMNEKSIMVYVDAIWSRSPKIDASLVSISRSLWVKKVPSIMFEFSSNFEFLFTVNCYCQNVSKYRNVGGLDNLVMNTFLICRNISKLP